MTITWVFQKCMLERNFNLHLKKKKKKRFIKVLYFHCKDLLENSCAHFSLKTQVQKNIVSTITFRFLLGRGEKRPKIPWVLAF